MLCLFWQIAIDWSTRLGQSLQQNLNPIHIAIGCECSEQCYTPEDAKPGYGHEWENENVIHLRFNPAPHSYGKQHTVLFTKNDITEPCKANHNETVRGTHRQERQLRLCSSADIELDEADDLLNQFGHLIKNTDCNQSFTKYIDPLARSSYTIETIMEYEHGSTYRHPMNVPRN